MMVAPSGKSQISDIRLDSALSCLVAVSQIYKIFVNVDVLRSKYVPDGQPMDKIRFMRAAKDIGIKTQLFTMEADRLGLIPLPAIAILPNGNFVTILNNKGKNIVLYDPYYERPLTIPIENFIKVWNGEIILTSKRFSWKRIGQEFNLSWFFPIFLKYKVAFLEVIAGSFILQLFGLVTPLFTQVIIDKVLVHRGVSTLDVLVIGLFIIYFFDFVLNLVRTYLLGQTTNKIDVILGARVYTHLNALPLPYFEARRVGDTVARVRELENIRQFITGSAITVFLDAFFAFVFIVVMLFYSAQLSIVSIGAIPLYILLSWFVTPLYRKQLQDRFDSGAENHSFLVESVNGIRTIKSLAIENRFNEKWEHLLARYVKVSFDTVNLANIANNTGKLMQGLTNLLILWLGAHLVMDRKLTVGELIAFQMLANQVNAPIQRIVGLWQSFQQTRVSVERLGDILNAPIEPIYDLHKTALQAIRGNITFDKVIFRYRQDGPEVLRQISFHIGEGLRVGIVGESGSGKSTVAKLIQRMYLAESGRILIDSIDMHQLDPTWLRQQVGVVLQDCFLFNGTIRENIAISKPGAGTDEIIQAAKLAGAHDFIVELPEGYDTKVGERGVAISGGQQQRVAIARTLLTKPQVLIFDEATSALDYRSERIVMDNMERICSGRTVIIIAHRLSTVQKCNVILVMDKGEIVEQGTHDELMQRKGKYYSLYNQQEVI